MIYDEALTRLAALGRLGVRPGLEATRRVLDALGRPEQTFAALHIAGTNGKGSTAAFAESILRAAGLRTGLYTSPHLSRFTERIRVGGREIMPRGAALLASRVLSRTPSTDDAQLTFFEAATVMAFLAFAEAGVDVAVIECGLGGRLDATRLCRAEVTVITNVSLDHTELLGDTVAAIAAEKAGIVRPGVPLVTGRLAGEAETVIAARAHELAVLRHRLGVEIQASAGPGGLSYEGWGGKLTAAPLGLHGAHQVDNAALALAATALLPALASRPADETARRSGLAGVSWPGRLEQLDHDLWLDGAHNPDGARALAAALPALDIARPVLLLGVLADKDVGSLVRALVPHAGAVVCTRPPSPRALGAAELAAAVAPHVTPGTQVVAIESPDGALVESRRRAAAADTVVVACGSLYLVGAVRRLCTREPADPFPVADPPAR